jgi:hypothetical protein
MTGSVHGDVAKTMIAARQREAERAAGEARAANEAKDAKKAREAREARDAQDDSARRGADVVRRVRGLLRAPGV